MCPALAFPFVDPYNELTYFPALFKSTFMSLKTYFSDAITELHRVSWPTRSQAIRIVVITLVAVVVSALIFGAFDQLLAWSYAQLLTLAQ